MIVLYERKRSTKLVRRVGAINLQLMATDLIPASAGPDLLCTVLTQIRALWKIERVLASPGGMDYW